MRGLISLLAFAGVLLSSCQTTSDPSTGRTVLSTPTFGQLLGLQTGTAAAGGAITSGPERYAQQLGAKSTNLTLTPEGNGQWLVDASMGQPDCVGEAKGIATETSPGVLSMTRDFQGNQCGLQIRRNAGAASIGELGCAVDHGGACEFAGDLTRTN